MPILRHLLIIHLNEAGADPVQAGLQVDFEEKMADPSRYSIGHNIHPATDNPDGEGMSGPDDGSGAPYDGSQVADPSAAPPAAPPGDEELQSIPPGGPGGGPPQQPMESIEMNEYENKLVDLFLEELFDESDSTELTERGPYNEPYNKPTVDYYDRTGIAAGQPGVPQNFGTPSPQGPPAPGIAAPGAGMATRQATPAKPYAGNVAQGMTDKSAGDMQRYLNAYNGPNAPQLAVDNKFGPKSTAALNAFKNRPQGGGTPFSGSPDRVDTRYGPAGGTTAANTGGTTGPGWGTAATAAAGASSAAGMRALRPGGAVAPGDTPASTTGGGTRASFNDRVEQRLGNSGQTGANRPAWAGPEPEPATATGGGTRAPFNDRVEQRLGSSGQTGANRPAWAGPEPVGAAPAAGNAAADATGWGGRAWNAAKTGASALGRGTSAAVDAAGGLGGAARLAGRTALGAPAAGISTFMHSNPANAGENTQNPTGGRAVTQQDVNTAQVAAGGKPSTPPAAAATAPPTAAPAAPTTYPIKVAG